MSAISLVGLGRTFPGGVNALNALDLDIADGEFLVIVGPSGCGKSTLLRLVAGLERPSTGAVLIDGKDVTNVSPRDRDIAMVFQSYALYPYMTVRENLGFGLRVRKRSKATIKEHVAHAAKLLDIEDLLDRKPAALSGGQRQRVAMGRAIVREPSAYLLDEPLSNLDAQLRVSMRTELARLHQRLGVTTLYVTHDQTEAMTLGQRVVVLNKGQLQQCATPQEMYEHPANTFVAGFVGSPPMNLVKARATDDIIQFGEHRIALPTAHRGLSGPVTLGIRPTALMLTERPDPATTISVQVEVVEHLGLDTNLIFNVGAALPGFGDRLFIARIPGNRSIGPGASVHLMVDADDLLYFDAESGVSLRFGGERPRIERVAGCRT